MDTKAQLYIPKHIAIIMDGNGRWAKKQSFKDRIFGHKNGVKSVREATEGCVEFGVQYLTLYAFSSENWSRPKLEVNALMDLLVSTLHGELETLQKNKIRLQAIGDLASLPKNCYKELQQTIKATSNNDQLTLTLALSYGSRNEIIEATKEIAAQYAKGQIEMNQIDDSLFASFLSTKDIPDPELVIRTSGELRLSNFLLWQLAYAELYFTDVLWPDFTREHLKEAIHNYNSRERRFGKTSEQLSL